MKKTSKKRVLCLLSIIGIVIVTLQGATAQTLKPSPNTAPKTDNHTKITNIKVDSTYKDPKTGRWIEVVSYEEDGMKITQTKFIAPPVGVNEPVDMSTINLDSIVVVVEKEANLLYLLHKRKRIKQYRAVFGPDRMKDKFREGDRCTPEGWFRILSVRDHSSWQKFMLLDYPNAESYKRFNERKQKGLIPAGASIGYAIGIHGIFKGGDKMVEMGIGWTDGCVSLSSRDINDLAKFVKTGTRVYIKRDIKKINN